jgi:hypothetical protein
MLRGDPTLRVLRFNDPQQMTALSDQDDLPSRLGLFVMTSRHAINSASSQTCLLI